MKRCEMFIIRKIEGIGNKKIKLTCEEIKQAAEIYNNNRKDEVSKYYREELKKMISEDYSEEFSKYFQEKYNDYFEQLVETCYYNQYLIDEYGIVYIYDLEEDCNEIWDNAFKKMQKEKEKMENIFNNQGGK